VYVCRSMSVFYGHGNKLDASLKGKGKAVPLDAMEALGGRGGIAPSLILDLGT